MKYTYIIQFANDKFYRSNHDYVSVSYRQVDHEIDATVMGEEDLRYLVKEKELPSFTRVMVCLERGDYPICVGMITLEDIEGAMGLGN